MGLNSIAKENNLSNRLISIDYLRSFLLMLVVLHHVLVGYTSSGFGSLIVDANKFPLFDYLTLLFDIFFMPLFFFISGLFALKSLQKRGVGKFLGNRAIRLGIPFLIGSFLLNLPGYYIRLIPYTNFKLISISDFFKYWIETDRMSTPAHLWFLWVLLGFNCIIALVYKIVPNLTKKIENSKSKFFTHPWCFLLVFLLLGIASYLPISKVYNGWFISVIGPLTVQLCRIILYFTFFFIGAVIGGYGIDRSIFKTDGVLVKKWWLMLIGTILSYSGTMVIYSSFKETLWGKWLLSALFVATAMFISFLLLALFRKYVKKQNPFSESLRRNAYGIYIIHYSIVAIFQFLFLRINISGGIKALSVFVLSVLVSWALIALSRRIPVVKKVIG